LALAATLVAVLGTSPGAHAKEPVLLLRAFAVNMSGGGRAAAGTIDIGIERWTTDDERAKLFNVLVERGSDHLLDALQDIKPRAGYVRTSNSLGWDVYYARELPLPDGARRIVLATNRPMSFWERRNQPRSAEYEHLLMDPPGKGWQAPRQDGGRGEDQVRQGRQHHPDRELWHRAGPVDPGRSRRTEAEEVA
jgi:hypothetical protein